MSCAMDKVAENIEDRYTEQPKILTWLISAVFFMQMLDGTILNTALPAIAKSINENPLEIQSIIIAYTLTIAFFLPMTGWIADKFGAKKVFISAILIFILSSGLCAFSNSLTELVIYRIFQGIGGAMMAPIGRLIVIKLYPKKSLVRVLSFIMLPALFGPVLGPPLGGFLVEFLSWHWIFLINIPIGTFLILTCIFKMPEVEKEEISKFDWIGFLSLSSAIVIICVISNQLNIIGIPPRCKVILGSLAFFLLVFFGVHINKCSRPLFTPKIFKIKSFVVGIVGNILSRLGFSAMPLLIPLLLQVGLGISPSRAGLMMLAIGFASIFGKFGIEKLLNFMGYRALLTLNTVLIGVVICTFALINKDTSEHFIIFLLAMLGIVNSIQFTAMNTLAVIDLPKKLSSDGNSLLSVIMQVGFVLGISIGGSLLNVVEEINKGKDLLLSFHITFIILGIFTVLSSISFLFTPQKTGGLKR